MNSMRFSRWPMRVFVVGCLAGAFTLAGCTKNNDPGFGETSSASPTTCVSRSTDNDPRSLESVLLKDVDVTGYSLDTDAASSGPIDYDAALASAIDPVIDATRLTSEHFLGGFSRGWSRSQGDTINLVSYEFNSATEAQSYQAEDFKTALARGAVSFDTNTISCSRGYTFDQAASSPVQAWRTHTVTFTYDNRWYLVVSGGPPTSDGPGTKSSELAVKLATSEARLATNR